MKNYSFNLHTILDTIREAENIKVTALSMLINHIQESNDGNPLTFSDETGYPTYMDCADATDCAVVGIRVKNGQLEFNLDCGDDDFGLNPNSWFEPDLYGRYNFNDLFSNVVMWDYFHGLIDEDQYGTLIGNLND